MRFMSNFKALLVGVNAKYIHTSLSVRTLCAYVNSPCVSYAEFNINEDAGAVCAELYNAQADMVLFSCYIWNIEFILRVSRRLKSVAPDIKIIFGGPEVSYAAQKYMQENPFLDAVIRGEGEETLRRIIKTGTLNHKGVTFRDRDNKIISREDRQVISDLSKIPFPYTEEDIEENKNKLIYYETSRGCPFRCSYCLSSTDHNVRFRDLQLVFREFLFFIEHQVRIVKLTDRTFNANRRRTQEMIRFLIDHASKTTFHFEIAADILDDETLALLKMAPKGLFQLEIGVQSTNPKTLAAIDRKADTQKIARVVKIVRSFGNMHTHLDLIAGLPYEDFESFRQSFNDVFAMEPHVIQLGFLKLLHGTKIRKEETDAIFTAEPPYEVLQTKYISYAELLHLKQIEDMTEKYYNSGAFEQAVKYLLTFFDSPFDFFDSLAAFYQENGFDKIGISRDRLYEILVDFARGVSGVRMKEWIDLLLFDYLMHNKPRTPDWAARELVTTERFDILTEKFIEDHLPQYCGMPVKQIIKHLHFERFFYPERILIFDRDYDRWIEC